MNDFPKEEFISRIEKIQIHIEKENIYGTQFHPEKSDKMGLKMISNFINL